MSTSFPTSRPAAPGHHDIQQLNEIWPGFAEGSEAPSSSDQPSSALHVAHWEFPQSFPFFTSNDANYCESQDIAEANVMNGEHPSARAPILDAAAVPLEASFTSLSNPVSRYSSSSPTSNCPIIDLRSPRPLHPLKDDIRCVERLSRPDQGHPHFRLALLWYLCFHWCAENHALALETWLGIIEGDESDDDLWLWEDGDEVWMSNLVWFTVNNPAISDPTAGFQYPPAFRLAISRLTDGEWHRAKLALECRLKRVQIYQPVHGELHEITSANSISPRISAFVWLLMQSKRMKFADQQRGFRRLLYQSDSYGLLQRWVMIKLLISPPCEVVAQLSLQEGVCSGCRQWADGQGQWMATLSTICPIHDIEAVCRELISCSKGCMSRSGPLFHLGRGYHPLVLTPEISSLAQLLDDTQSCLEQEESSPAMLLQNVDTNMELTNAAPPILLALVWVLFCDMQNSDVYLTLDSLLSVIEATDNDESLYLAEDFWSLNKNDEEWLRQNIVVNHPKAKYSSWVNKYPSSWRHWMTLLTVADWSRFRRVVEGRRYHHSPLSHTRNSSRLLSIRRDGYVWIGALMWIVQHQLGLQQLHPNPFDDNTFQMAWFSQFWKSRSIIDTLNLSPLELPQISYKCREAVAASGHHCYLFASPALDVYAVLVYRIDETDNIPLPGLRWDECSACNAGRGAKCTSVASTEANLSTPTSSTTLSPRLPPRAIQNSDIPVESLSSTTVLLFDASLAQFMAPSSSAGQWLEANSHNIADKLGSFPCFGEKNRSECRLLTERIPIYQRFLVYTFVHLRLCEPDSRLLDILKGTSTTFSTWDDITFILNHRVVFGQLWALLRSCRNASRRRPHRNSDTHLLHPDLHSCDTGENLKKLLALDIIGICARVAVILEDGDRRKCLVTRQGHEAQSILDLLQAFLDYPHLDPRLQNEFRRALFQLSRNSGRFPECLVLTGVEKVSRDPVGGGTYGDVSIGKVQGSMVAIKTLRLWVKSDVEKLLKEFSNEAVIWRQLFHPNVLPFYGVYHLDNNRSRVCLISPWMENGTIIHFLEQNPDKDRVTLALDVAQGLDYLHTMNPHIIHGDLKGANILITSSHRACLADFGLSSSGESRILRHSSGSHTRLTGTVRWQAPELLRVEPEGSDSLIRNTPSCDVYSFACVCYEVFSGNVPLHDVSEWTVPLVVNQGRRPSRPSHDVCLRRGLDNDMWDLMEACWQVEPSSRPTAGEIVAHIRAKPSLPMDTRPPSNWDNMFVSQLRSNLTHHPFCFSPDDVVHTGHGNPTNVTQYLDEGLETAGLTPRPSSPLADEIFGAGSSRRPQKRAFDGNETEYDDASLKRLRTEQIFNL